MGLLVYLETLYEAKHVWLVHLSIEEYHDLVSQIEGEDDLFDFDLFQGRLELVIEKLELDILVVLQLLLLTLVSLLFHVPKLHLECWKVNYCEVIGKQLF